MTVAMIRPLQRPVPLRQSVYDALIDLIVGGELPPGQHMVETDLARQLGVSRQPIREALHRMEAEGWVDLRPSQGAFVHVPTDSEVDELLDVRALLEAETARLAAASSSPVRSAQLARLREICQFRDASGSWLSSVETRPLNAKRLTGAAACGPGSGRSAFIWAHPGGGTAWLRGAVACGREPAARGRLARRCCRPAGVGQAGPSRSVPSRA